MMLKKLFIGVVVIITVATCDLEPLRASEFTYYATVLDAEPVASKRPVNRLPDNCYNGKPSSFTAILNWDIKCAQPQYETTTSYRVRYEIEGKTFSTTTDKAPGEKIPVRLSFN